MSAQMASKFGVMIGSVFIGIYAGSVILGVGLVICMLGLVTAIIGD